jgi:fatty-acyl-CoA synthase
MGNLSMVAFGCTLVYPSPRFDPLLTLQATVEYRCTSLYGVPTMFIAMLDHPEFSKFKFEVLRTGIMAGALCPVETMSRVIKEMGANEVTIAYGMTETSPVSWQTRIGTPLDLTCTTVGQICPHAECKVVDAETWKVLPCGEPGELWTAGYLVMRGYWNNPEATAVSIIEQDGRRWMRTGDLAVISEEGFCQIVGRIKDMILRGGENIFPKEVEGPLMTHPDISLAEVIGVPDRRLGEQVCAWVQWRGGAPKGAEAKAAEQRIRDYLRDKVAHFKIPKYILFKDEFPLTASNKVRKVEMREISAVELGLVQPSSKL